jgi:hypothetical protein
LRCSAERFGDEAVSDLQFFEDRKFQCHRLLSGEFV